VTVVLVVLAWSGPSSAAPTAQERIVAQALFEDGRRLMREGKAQQACIKFEESNRLDPAVGTQFNLADCYERIGRHTRAWILFVDVAASARALQQTDREAAARARAAALEGKLTRLAIKVPRPSEGLNVTRDGEPVPAPQWGTAVPIEPGRHRIEAHAPGRQSWLRDVEVGSASATVSVTVPPLRAAPPPAIVEPNQGIDARRAAAIAMAALAVGAAAAGTAAGIVAIERKNDAEPYCPEPDGCYQRGLDLREEAREAAAIATVSFVVAASAAAGGLVLWLTAPEPERSKPGISAGIVVAPGGGMLIGRW